MSKLNDILKEDVLSEINEILSEADVRAETLIREAKSRASEQVEAHRKRVEAELQAALRGMKSARELTVSVARIRARDQEIALVKERVKAAIQEMVARPNYGEILEALAEEAFRSVEAAGAATVHPDDKDKLSAWAKRKGLELTTDPALHLGVRITTPGGQQSVENSLPERIQRGWETLMCGVAQRLWGEPGSLSKSEK
jgi:vacuolar-type H+-ATPase subunit E/Vma4